MRSRAGVQRRLPPRHGIVHLAGLLLAVVTAMPAAAQESKPFLTFGIFIGSMEEGARVFTPTRLLPRQHPEAAGHDFPTTQVHHVSEFETLLVLGEHIGLRLRATLQRYPREPVTAWAYPGFEPAPSSAVRAAKPVPLAASCSPVPGLRVVAYSDRQPVSFIVDTRGMSLQARGMERSTASGLDITRDAFVTGLDVLSAYVPERGTWVLVLDAAVEAACRP